MPIGKWGDGGKYGDGGLWNSIVLQAQEYFAYVDKNALRFPYLTTWNLQSPNTNVWVPSITIGGILSFTEQSVTASAVPLLPGVDGTFWTPTISNAGILTLTSGASESQATTHPAIIDSNNITWYWYIKNSLAYVSTLAPWRSDIYYLSPRVRYTAPTTTEVPFRVYSSRAYSRIGAERLARHEAAVEAVTNRISVKIRHSGSKFAIYEIVVRANIKKKQEEG